MSIIKPYTVAQVKSIASDWDSKYGGIDEVIFFAFRTLSNSEPDLTTKCKLLKTFYKVPRPEPIYAVVEHINRNVKDPTKRVSDGDSSIVEDIARIPGRTRQFSFATKFCSFHNPISFPICDTTVVDVLRHEGVTNNSFTTDYDLFKYEVDDFIVRNNLEGCSYKEIDHFLQAIFYNRNVKQKPQLSSVI